MSGKISHRSENAIKLKSKLLLPVVLLFVINCATIFSKREYRVAVDSNVQGATVEYKYNARTSIKTFQTPGTFSINFREFKFNQNDPFIDVSSPGYQTQRIFIQRSFSYYILLNYFLIISSPFMVIDILSGAIWKPLKKQHYIHLKKIENVSGE